MNEPLTESDAWVDEALAPFRSFVAALLAVPEPFVDDATGEGLRVDSMRITMPFELDAEDFDGRVRLAGGPPTLYTETSVSPVYHQLTVHIVSDPMPTDG